MGAGQVTLEGWASSRPPNHCPRAAPSDTVAPYPQTRRPLQVTLEGALQTRQEMNHPRQPRRIRGGRWHVGGQRNVDEAQVDARHLKPWIDRRPAVRRAPRSLSAKLNKKKGDAQRLPYLVGVSLHSTSSSGISATPSAVTNRLAGRSEVITLSLRLKKLSTSQDFLAVPAPRHTHVRGGG